MILTNTDKIEGRKIVQTLGLVKGSTIRAKHLGKDIIAVVKMLIGGEIKEYSDMLEEARAQAIKRMIQNAEQMGADAVINVRFTTSMVMSGAAEILVYGTAVKLD